MITDNRNSGNGEAIRPRGFLSVGMLERLIAGRDPAVERGTQLAGLTTRQFRRVQGAPGGWNRFLIAHLRWILIITLLVVGAAAALAHSQTPQYTSTAEVDTYFTPPDPNSVQGPNMVDQKAIVSSYVVLKKASSELAGGLGVPVAKLQHGLSVTVPASSSILDISYSDPVPLTAQARAAGIAQAYVTYLQGTTPNATSSKHPKTTNQVGTPKLYAAVINPATLPKSASSPRYLIDILAALVVGLGLSIGTAAIRDHLDDRLRSPVDLESETGAPVLALVPAFRSVTRDPASRLVTVWNPDSVITEAYRGIRTRVIAVAAARSARTLLVTSPSWEKKSTIAANLAAALAQSGRRTVLVCADLRWGNASELFGVGNDDGLTTVLDRRTDLAAAVKATRIRGLWVLPAGPLPHDPAEYLQRPALRTLLGELRRNADFVIIDAPPVLATQDVAAVKHLAEMILLVGDARKTTRAHMRAALHELEEVASRLVGCVLYNVGRRHWVRKSPLAAVAIDLPELDLWSRPERAGDGEPTPSQRTATNVNPTSGPS